MTTNPRQLPAQGSGHPPLPHHHAHPHPQGSLHPHARTRAADSDSDSHANAQRIDAGPTNIRVNVQAILAKPGAATFHSHPYPLPHPHAPTHAPAPHAPALAPQPHITTSAPVSRTNPEPQHPHAHPHPNPNILPNATSHWITVDAPSTERDHLHAPAPASASASEPDPETALDAQLIEVESSASRFRFVAEFLVIVVLAIILARGFLAETYIVPTGSMAPFLFGNHMMFQCPECRHAFAVGMDEKGNTGSAFCFNCGHGPLDRSLGRPESGDRLVVRKHLFDLQPPARWDVVVFRSMFDPAQPFIKRIVGMPGESLTIRKGDIYINDKIARKTLDQLAQTRVMVYETGEISPQETKYPRWVCRRGNEGRPMTSGWQRQNGDLTHRAVPGLDDDLDWLFYRHWDGRRGDYGPIMDDCPYNSSDLPAENRVKDLILTSEVSVGRDVKAVMVRLQSGGDQFRIAVPVDGRGVPTVRRNDVNLEVTNPRAVFTSSTPEDPKVHLVEFAVCDQRLFAAVNGIPVFDPIDFDDPVDAWDSRISPAAIAILGGEARFRQTRIYRDVYYTEHLSQFPLPGHAVGKPFQLGPNEFFVLGDNSPISQDSRFWDEHPTVQREHILGRPLVKIPDFARLAHGEISRLLKEWNFKP